ncbi:MAG: flagellar export protein FliJ [Magnetococcales bacterium]|nr:flagellar export protein FliJ [Magnetococcales bacterium]
MNRFARLRDLRKIREDAAGHELARALAYVETVRHKIAELDQATQEEKEAAMATLAGPQRASPGLLESFLAGQAWRRGRLTSALQKARQESEEARDLWLAARLQLRQAEALAEKEALRLSMEQKRKEAKELDMVGILSHTHRQNGFY